MPSLQECSPKKVDKARRHFLFIVYFFSFWGFFSVVFLFCFSFFYPLICFTCPGRPVWPISLQRWAKSNDGVSHLYPPLYVAKATNFFPLLLHLPMCCPCDSEYGNFHVIIGQYSEFLLKYCKIESGLTLARINPHWGLSRHNQLFSSHFLPHRGQRRIKDQEEGRRMRNNRLGGT